MDYYSLFSFSAKKAIFRASELCQQYRNQYMDPEHILASILNLQSCSAVQVLNELQVNLPKLIIGIEAYLQEHTGSFQSTPQFSNRTIKLLDLSFKEVKRLHHREIGTTHLLIALSEDRSSFINQLFKDHNIEAQRLRDTFNTFLRFEEQSPGRAVAQPAPSGRGARGLAALGLTLNPALFTNAAADALKFAGALAALFGSAVLEPEHVLYAYLHQWQALLSYAPAEYNQAWAGLAAELYASFVQSTGTAECLPQAGPRLAEVLGQALKEAVCDKHDVITSFDLFRALLCSTDPALHGLLQGQLGRAPEDVAGLIAAALEQAAGAESVDDVSGGEPEAAQG